MTGNNDGMIMRSGNQLQLDGANANAATVSTVSTEAADNALDINYITVLLTQGA